MALTETSLVQKAFAALVTAGADPTKIKLPHLLAAVPDALELFSKRMAIGGEYEDLQSDFTLTPAAGVLDLSAQTTMLFDIARARLRIAATGVLLTPVDCYATLEDSDLPSDQVWYALDGGTLRFRSTTPSLVDYATQIKVRASYVASLTDANFPIPFSYEGAVVRTLLELLAMGEVAREAAELIGAGG